MITSKKFRKAMEEIDTKLQEKNIKIHARPLHAIGEIAKHFDIKDDIPIKIIDNAPMIFSPEYISTHINNWYEKRYGERLKADISLGSVAILIRGTPWEAKLPVVYGSVRFVIDHNLPKYRKLPSFGKTGEKPIYNVLLAIKDLPDSLADELTLDEQQFIFEQIIKSINALQNLSYYSKAPFINEAYVDLQSAVSNLVGPHPHYGMSRWASLQFTEKIIKSILAEKKMPYPNTHNLSRLSEILKENQICNLNEKDLSKIQCSAGIRYGEESASLISAMEAHHKSLKITYDLLS